MRALRVVAAILCVLLLAIPTMVVARAATAPAFRWTGTADDCPVVPGAPTTRCLNALQGALLASLVVGSALGITGIAGGRPRLARLGAAALLAAMATTLGYRALAGGLLMDDLLAALFPLAVASALLLAVQAPSRAVSPS